METIESRFWRKVRMNDVDGCWEWTAAAGRDGYGQLWVNGRPLRAHRVSYELVCGPIPDGMLALHRCDNSLCVRPDHIFLGSHCDNVIDMVTKGRQAAGEGNGRAKLTEDQVKKIRSQYSNGEATQRDIAKQYGVGHQLISRIVRGDRWARKL